MGLVLENNSYLLMSNRSKIPKKQIKKDGGENKKIQDAGKTETKEIIVFKEIVEQKQAQMITTQSPTPLSPPPSPPSPLPAKLTIVHEASISSEEGQSRKQYRSSKAKGKFKSEQEKDKIEQPHQIKQEPIQQQAGQDQYNVLKISGLLDAYQHFLKLLCKHGLPTGRIYDYAAQQIQKYQKRKINRELKMRAQLDIQKISKRSDMSSLSLQKPKNASPYYS